MADWLIAVIVGLLCAGAGFWAGFRACSYVTTQMILTKPDAFDKLVEKMRKAKA